MTYLVDVNVLSEPTKPAPDAKVVGWLTANEGDFVVDSIILGELRIGILTLAARSQADLNLSAGLQTWWRQLIACLGMPRSVVAGLNWSWSRGAKGTFCPCWTG